MERKLIKIAPSILSADFGRLADEIRTVEAAGADLIHIDVMDGHFVPNLTYGPIIIEKCRKITSLPLDVHLMITNAEERLDSYLDAGANYLSIHVEAVKHLQRALDYIRKKGAKAGVVLNPATPLETITWAVDDIDFILLMTVNPGYGAQAFIPNSMAKIEAAARLLREAGSKAEIEVDGGVGPGNAGSLAAAGATILVAGNSIFHAKEPAVALRDIASAALAARH